jgi:hypothetical protein
MKTNYTIKSLFLTSFICISSLTFGQKTFVSQKRTPTGKIRCATNEYEKYLQVNDPQRETRAEFEKWLAPKMAEYNTKTTNRNVNTVIYIPVVIHIIHNGDALGTNENITDAQALSQITVLNQDFRKMISTPGYNTNPVGADMEIQFVMAQRKPDNVTATNGIDRVQKTTANYSTFASVQTLKTETSWDPTKYFNIWTVFFSNSAGTQMYGTLGYAQFPSSSGLSGLNANEGDSNTDGLVIDYRCFGSAAIASGQYFVGYDGGRTATHEIGHCFGLLHIWGDGTGDEMANLPDCTASDYCADTPQAGWEHYSCGSFDTCPSVAGNDMPENYMDYTTDSCMNIFTLNQKGRVATVMANCPNRATLATSNAGISLGMTDFEFNAIRIYPNPAHDLLNIAIKGTELPNAIIVYNTLSQVVLSRNILNANDLIVNTSSYNNGIYFIKVIKDGASKMVRFIKE